MIDISEVTNESNEELIEPKEVEVVLIEPKVKHKSATKIQSLWRGFRARKEKKLTLKAIVMIQRVFKGFKARQKYKKLLAEARWLKDTPASTAPTLTIIKKTSGIAGRKRPTRGKKVESKEVISTATSIESDENGTEVEGGDDQQQQQQASSSPKVTLIGGMGMPAIPKFDPSQITLKARPRIKEDRHSIADLSMLTNKAGNPLSNSADSTPISSPLNLRKSVLTKTSEDSTIKPEPQPFFSPQLLRKTTTKVASDTSNLPPLNDEESIPAFKPIVPVLKKKASSFLNINSNSANSTPDLEYNNSGTTIPPPLNISVELEKPKFPVLRASSLMSKQNSESNLPRPITVEPIIPPLPKVELDSTSSTVSTEEELLPPIFGVPPPIPTDFDLLPPISTINSLPPPFIPNVPPTTVSQNNNILPPPIINNINNTSNTTPNIVPISLPSIKPTVPSSNRPSLDLPPPIINNISTPPPITTPNNIKPLNLSLGLPPPILPSSRPLNSSLGLPPPIINNTIPPPIINSTIPPPIISSNNRPLNPLDLPPPIINSNIPTLPPIIQSNNKPSSGLPPPIINNTIPPPISNSKPLDLPPPIINNIPNNKPLNTSLGLPPPIISNIPTLPPNNNNKPLPPIITKTNSINLPPPLTSTPSTGSLPPPIFSQMPPTISTPSTVSLPPPIMSQPPLTSTGTLPKSNSINLPPPLTSAPSTGSLPPPLKSTPSTGSLPPPIFSQIPPTMSTPPPLMSTPVKSQPPPLMSTPSTGTLPKTNPINLPPPLMSTPSTATLPPSIANPPPLIAKTNPTNLPPPLTSAPSTGSLPPPLNSSVKMVRKIKDGWREYNTPEGKKYYHHKEQNITTWNENDAYIMVPETPIPVPTSPQPPPPTTTSINSNSNNNNNTNKKDEWVEMKTKEGITYYYNAATDVTKWSKPVDIKADPNEKKRVGGLLSKFLKKRPTKNELVKKNILTDDTTNTTTSSSSKSSKSSKSKKK